MDFMTETSYPRRRVRRRVESDNAVAHESVECCGISSRRNFMQLYWQFRRYGSNAHVGAYVSTDLLKSSAPAPASNISSLLAGPQIFSTVQETLSSIPFVDIHTHLFTPALGNLGLWGIDELLTYHYLEAEFFRNSDVAPEAYLPP
jgi:hypothetical protein